MEFGLSSGWCDGEWLGEYRQRMGCFNLLGYTYRRADLDVKLCRIFQRTGNDSEFLDAWLGIGGVWDLQ